MRTTLTRLAIAAAAVTLAAGGRASATVTETTTEPYPAVRYTVRVDTDTPSRAHIVRVDLTSLELRLHATAEPERGATVSAWARAAGVQIAVNGDLFDPLTFHPDGLAMGDGAVWSLTEDDGLEGFLRFDRNLDVNHATLVPPEILATTADLPAGTEGVVSGRPLLVRGGVAATSFDCGDVITLPCERAPRTALGLSSDGRTLLLVVVDGWGPESEGMTVDETAALLIHHGAYSALALDPAGSAALFIENQGGLVSAPSDGAERPVANHLGIRHGALPAGSMIGHVRVRDINNVDQNIVDATVSLDDGDTTGTTNTNGLYELTGLTPRYTCATARKAGYHPATSCRDVPIGGQVWNSIALFPNGDFIDAAHEVTDAAPPADARRLPDARPVADGASPPDGAGAVDGGGGGDPGGPCDCRAARRASAPGLGACVLALIQAILVRSIGPRRARRRSRSIRDDRLVP